MRIIKDPVLKHVFKEDFDKNIIPFIQERIKEAYGENNPYLKKLDSNRKWMIVFSVLTIFMIIVTIVSLLSNSTNVLMFFFIVTFIFGFILFFIYTIYRKNKKEFAIYMRKILKESLIYQKALDFFEKKYQIIDAESGLKEFELEPNVDKEEVLFTTLNVKELLAYGTFIVPTKAKIIYLSVPKNILLHKKYRATL